MNPAPLTTPREIQLEVVALHDLEPQPAASEEGILSARELSQCRQFKTAKRRRDWVAGRLAAKRLVRRKLGEEGRRLAMRDIEVRRLDSGEPCVELPGVLAEGLHPISISHSPRYALAALGAPGMRLGVDIETIETREKSWLELLAHESEMDLGLAGDPVRQTLLWTLKEAVTKALGVGLSVDLWDIRVLRDPQGTPAAALGPVRLELRGKAREIWEKLGRPAIDFKCTVLEDGSALSVAYTKPRPQGASNP